MPKNISYEIYWLRFISCLSVVFIHAIESGIYLNDFNISATTNYLVEIMKLSLMFATPTFIFISEFLLSKSYPDGLPKGFFIKRIKFIFIPYLAMSIIYAIVFIDNYNLKSLTLEIIDNAILGNFVAYFVLVIFQFYLLHFLFYKKLQSWNGIMVMFISLAINISYLAFFMIINPPTDTGLFHYLWIRGHWLFFPAWLFYFSLGYYAGRNYTYLLSYLKKFKWLVFLAPIFTLCVSIIISTYVGFGSSKRADIIFYTTTIIFLIIYTASKLNQPPKIVLFISKYSFSIYLLHKLVVDTLAPISSNIFIHIFCMFLAGIIFSVIVSFILNQLPFGKYLVGQIAKTRINKIEIPKSKSNHSTHQA